MDFSLSASFERSTPTTPTLFSDFEDLNSTTIKLRVMTDEAVTNTRFYEGLHLPIDDPLYCGSALLLLHLDLALQRLSRRLLLQMRADTTFIISGTSALASAPTSTDSVPLR